MNGKSSKQHSDTTGGGSRIPVMSPSPLRRSGSLRLSNCPPIREHSDFGFKLSRQRSLQSLNTPGAYGFSHGDDDDDLESVKSCASVGSVCSSASQCDRPHAHYAHNGTTYSGRARRYVVHCSPHSTASDEYLTPTQRTNRTLRHLRNLLKEAQEELAEKEKEIARLTREVVELRLLKAADSTGSADAAQTDTAVSGSARSGGDVCSLSDSGHFEELVAHSSPAKLLPQTPGRVQQQMRNHEDEIRELKERHNERVDSLLQRITDVNDRYYALRPMYEDCKEQLREALKTNEELKSNIPNSQLITELQNSNKKLQATQEELLNKLNRLEKANQDLEAIRINHDKLTEENLMLKDKEHQLTICLEHTKEQEFVTTETLTKVSDELEMLRIIHVKLAEENASLKCKEEELVRLCTDKITLQTYEEDNQTDFFDRMSYTSAEVQTKDASEESERRYDSLESLKTEINYRIGTFSSKGPDSVDNSNRIVEGLVVQNGSKANGPVDPKPDVSAVLPDLLQKLQATQEELEDVKINYRRLLEAKRQGPNNDAETTLQFLKSAFYYFFTDRENARGHLAAIESILGFDDGEKSNIEKAYMYR